MIPSKWPDVTKLVLNYLRAENPGLKVSRSKTPDSKCVVVAVAPLQNDTAISRRYGIVLETWSGASDANPEDASSMMDDVLFQLQSWIVPVRWDSISGPRIVKDSSGFEYTEGSIDLVFSRK